MKTTLKPFVLFGFLIVAFSSNAQSWVNIPTPVTNNLILYDIRFPSQQNDTGYVAGSNNTYNGKGKIMKTTNSGLTWNIIYTSQVKNTGILAMDFTNTNNGFAGAMDGGLLVTTDAGANWTLVDIDNTSNQGEINVIEFFDTQQGILNTSANGIYLTTNAGNTWVKSTTSISGVQDINYVSETLVFAVSANQRIYKSTDGGNNWSLVFAGPNSTNYNLGVDFYDTQNGIVSSEDGEIFITTDGGATWSPVYFTQGGLIHDVLMKSTNRVSLACSPGQLFESTDGGQNWTTDSTSWNLPVSFKKIINTANGTEFICGSGPTGGTILRKEASITGVPELEMSEIMIAPNPVQNRFNISLLSENSVSEIIIVNLRGMVIWNQKTSSRNIEINSSKWTSGVYFVTVKSGAKISINKIIKL